MSCDSSFNTITIPTSGGWDTSIVNSSPSRSDTTISIPAFTFSKSYCSLDSYSITGTDSAQVSISGSSLTYKTDLPEPRTLSFNLVVNGSGGKTATFASTI